MNIQENIPLKGKTTMRIGGEARYYADLETKEDVEKAWQFAQEKKLPLIILGGGSNIIFADGTIEALVVRIKAGAVEIDGSNVRVEAGKHLAVLINELAEQDLDLSPLTGILGTVGGAIFGNAGQGPKGAWIDSFVESVTIFREGKWQTLSRKECEFRYRESGFKDMPSPLIIWQTELTVPSKPSAEVKEIIEKLLQRRIETQPHVKTAGSCFKAAGDKTPAWKLIDEAGLRGLKIGGVEISEKHANFLLNTEEGSLEDVCAIIERVQEAVPDELQIEMRMYGNDGQMVQ